MIREEDVILTEVDMDVAAGKHRDVDDVNRQTIGRGRDTVMNAVAGSDRNKRLPTGRREMQLKVCLMQRNIV